MRRFAYEQLVGDFEDDTTIKNIARLSSYSCVSQRDIQRVFTIYQWLLNIYKSKKPHGHDRTDYNRRAVLVALGVVYYMRLNAKYRGDYQQLINKRMHLPG